MAIYNFGSINIDHFYRLPHFPVRGETLSSEGYSTGIGGKGANQSVAAAKAGAKVLHIGALGKGDAEVKQKLQSHGVDCQFVTLVDGPSGHANIYVEASESRENMIVLAPGANLSHHRKEIENALSQATADDYFLLQNETNMVIEAAQFAQEKGAKIIYSAAPFDAAAVSKVLPYVTILVMNEGEAAQLCAAFDQTLEEIDVPEVIVTRGDKGAFWRSNKTGEVIEVESPKVTVSDTTGAGDTFLGYFSAGVDKGFNVSSALDWGVKAAALKVTRNGTADAIPTAAEVEAFFGS